MPATAVRHTNTPQSYWVRLTNGYVVLRNRTQINRTREEGLQTSSSVGPNEPNRAIVSNRVAEPNRAIVSNRVAEPNRVIVSNRVAELIGLSCLIVSPNLTGLSCLLVSTSLTRLSCLIV